MIFTETELKGAFIIEPERLHDDRGFFARAWCQREFEAHGLNPRLVQCNISFNKHKGTLRVRNVVERAVIGLAEQGVRSSIVRLPLIAHDTTDNAGFLPGLIALAKEKGFAGYPGDGMNAWNAVHIRDVASLFRLALEKGPAGRYWHAVQDEGIPFRDIAEAIGSRLDLPAVSVPMDVLMLPGYFGMFTNLVTLDLPASSLITRQTLGWEPLQPSLFADLDNGHYFPVAGA